MKDKLPKGWKWVKLEDVAEFQNGFAFKSSLFKKTGSPVIRISNLQKGVISEKNIKYFDERDYSVSFEKYKITKGDLVIAMSGATTGKISENKSDEVYYLNQRVGKIIPTPKIKKTLLQYFLKTQIEINLKKSFGSAIPNLSSKQILDIPFPLPPLQEQQKINRILENSLDKIDQTIGLINGNIEKLKQLNASVLDKVFFNLKDEKQEILVKIAEVKRGKSKHRPRNDKVLYDGKYPLIQTGDVRRAGKYITEFTKTYNEVGLAQSKLWKKGTVCLTIAANIGDVAILGIDACFPDSVLGIFSEEQNNHYIYYFLKSIQQQLDNKSSAAAQKNLSVSKLSDVLIPIPTIDKQKQIVKYLDHTTEKNNQLIQHYQNKLQSLQKLKKSVLDSAFKGKLKREVIKPLKEVKVIKFKELYPDPYIRKQRVAQKHKLKRRQVLTTTRIIDLHQKHNQKLGHTKTEKINHAIEYIGQFELGRDPVKNTGGPVDFYYVKSFVEPFAKEKKVFEAIEKKKSYHYEKGINFNTFLKVSYNDKYFNNYNAKIDEIINTFLFQPLWETELYMTVYTGWNNLIIRQEKVNLKTIHTESIELWIDKAEKFNITDVEKAINWLKTKNYMPAGYGKEVK